MSDIFLKLLNLCITASWLILAVILLRFLLKKAPKWISCVLWALVAFRLICPFSLESALSLVPSSETVNTTYFSARPYIQSGVDVIDNAANGYLGSHYYEGVTVTPKNSLTNPINVISIIWIIGMAAMLLYALISYIRLKKSVGASVIVRDNILACDDVKSPFILGIIKPLIYIPSSMKGETLDCVVSHESAHIQRRDHWWKPLGFLLLAVYWFNPLCWLAYIFLCRDIEMACDEKVIRNMDKVGVATYSQALLDCSFPRKGISACPLSFGEVGVKERVKSVLNYKKPAFWIILIAVLACVVTAVCFLTNPYSDVEIDEKCLKSAEESFENQTESHSFSENQDGTFTADNGKTYKYKLELVGHYRNAACDSFFIVLSNDNDLTFERVSESLFTSNSERFLNEDVAIIISMGSLDSMLEVYMANDSNNENNSGNSENADEENYDELKERYPEYFGLSAMKGLEVYVWQMGVNSYSFGLLSGTNCSKTFDELIGLKGTTASEMKAILSTYDISEDMICIIPYQNPFSSFIGDYWIFKDGESESSIQSRKEAYIQNIRNMLFDN